MCKSICLRRSTQRACLFVPASLELQPWYYGCTISAVSTLISQVVLAKAECRSMWSCTSLSWLVEHTGPIDRRLRQSRAKCKARSASTWAPLESHIPYVCSRQKAGSLLPKTFILVRRPVKSLPISVHEFGTCGCLLEVTYATCEHCSRPLSRMVTHDAMIAKLLDS